MKDLQEAVLILRSGGLVAFPTETVYGLGVDARNGKALERLYQVKRRPLRHPVIVHLADASKLSDWAVDIDPRVWILSTAFWPGPMTLVLRRAPDVLDAVTGGQDTIALRVPFHPIALRLLRDFEGGIAAPSANRFGRVSPTSADHVRADLGTDVDLILDGGPCQVGLESTIVNLVNGVPEILRPGGVTREELQRVLGCEVPLRGITSVRVSGALESHYAPRARVVVLPEASLEARAVELRSGGCRVVILNPTDVTANQLYASLRRADGEGAEVILSPMPVEEGLGLAVADRLRKASAEKR